MKASELAALLLRHPDREVVLSSDAEGNSYSPCRQVCTVAYEPETPVRGEVRLEPYELTEELRGKGYTEEDVADDGYIPALALWPSN